MVLRLLLWIGQLVFASRRAQALEIIALRHQLEVYQRQSPGRRLRLTAEDRRFWVLLRSCWRGWREAVLIVRPATVVRWHRELVRWQQRRQTRPLGRRPLPQPLQELIRRMAAENPLWGQRRIQGELQKLGIHVAFRSVGKYMGERPRRPPSVGWMAFLRAHAPQIWACDWFRVHTASLRTLYVFIVLAHARRQVIHFHVTDQPTDVWVAQQMVEATPFGEAPPWLLRDRDPLYGSTFEPRAASSGMHSLHIPRGRPECNCYVERLIRTLRQECFNHLIVINDRHLLFVLREYLRYYHHARPHQGLHQQTPLPKPEAFFPDGRVASRAVLGGLHHDYFRLAP